MKLKKTLLLTGIVFSLLLFCGISASAEIYSGECGADGDNVTWTLDTKTGVLEISGEGAMANYDSDVSTPWYEYSDWNDGYSNIKKCIICDGVTSIGDHAFMLQGSVTSVAIPSSVVSIGDYAFSGCNGLTSIAIPDNVTFIGENAFSGCGLASISIPTGMTSIGDYAFSCIEKLTSITIPDSVTSIGNYAFAFNTDLTNIYIPDSVADIGDNAFYMCGLTSIVIPDSVTSVGKYAFKACSSLRSVTIPDSVTSIGTEAFYGCSSLTDIYFTSSEAEWNAIIIGSNNDALINAVIHYNTVSVIINGKKAVFDVAPRVINERTMLPMRTVFEMLGATVDWHGESRTVISAKGSLTITLQLENSEMVVQDTATGETKTVILDSVPIAIDNRTLVPVRAVSEVFGYDVVWQGDSNTVIINGD